MFASVGIPLQTTYFYDLGTAIGFCATAAFSLFYPAMTRVAESAAVDGLFHSKTTTLVRATLSNTVNVLSVRQIVMASMITIWAIRFASLHFNVRGSRCEHGPHVDLNQLHDDSASSNMEKIPDSTRSNETQRPLLAHGRAKRLG